VRWYTRWLAVVAVGFVALMLGWAPAQASAAGPEPTDEVVLTLFHSEGCPHCAAEIAFLLDELAPEHPDLRMQAFEVYADAANRDLMVAAAQAYGFEPGAVPVTIIEGPGGFEVIVGFGGGTPQQIRAALDAVQAPPPSPPASGQPGADPPTRDAPADQAVVEVPLVGQVDVAGSSLLVATLVIGFVDGVNPCSLWVLSVLLAIVLHSGSRGRVALVGGVFLAVTAAMYAVYVAGVYSILTVLDAMVWIRVVVALVALTFGVLQLADGLAPGRAPSLSISPQRKPELYRRMRSVGLGERGVVATVAGTVVLAVGVSLLETPCTAGLPLLWANLVAAQSVSTGTAASLFGVYMLVFLLDELVVFGMAVMTLRSLKMAKHHGQALKIVAGSVLVTLAVAMVALPSALATVLGTVTVFAVALVAGLTIWLASRVASRLAQARSQREKIVPSSARAIDDSDRPGSGSGERPETMRRALDPTSVGTSVQHSSSSSPSATTSPSRVGPPSHSS